LCKYTSPKGTWKTRLRNHAAPTNAFRVSPYATAPVAYVLTLNAFVGAAWFRSLVFHVPFGDV